LGGTGKKCPAGKQTKSRGEEDSKGEKIVVREKEVVTGSAQYLSSSKRKFRGILVQAPLKKKSTGSALDTGL